MSDKTNEEKLKILQERLATIQQKKEENQEKKEENKYVAPVFEEALVNSEIKPIAKTKRQPKNNSSSYKYFITFFVIIVVITVLGLSGFYAYKNLNSLVSSDKKTENKEEIIYFKSDFDKPGNFIIILKEFNQLELANAEVQNLINKGFSCSVLQLSGVSNSKKELFQTYIGPFNKENEAYHYLNALISPKGILEDETRKSTVGTVVELQ